MDDMESDILICLQSGGNISQRNMTILGTRLKSLIQVNPEKLVNILKVIFCEVDSSIAAPKLLIGICQEISLVGESLFAPINEYVSTLASDKNFNLIAPFFNITFLMPVSCINDATANLIFKKMISLFRMKITSSDILEKLSYSIAHFSRKWCNLLVNHGQHAGDILSLMYNDFSFNVVSCLSQAFVNLVLALFDGFPDIHELIDSIIKEESTPLDRCTPIKDISFFSYIIQSKSLYVSIQLITAFINLTPTDYYSDLFSISMYLGNIVDVNNVEDESCFISVLNLFISVLKIMVSSTIETEIIDFMINVVFSLPSFNTSIANKFLKNFFDFLMSSLSKTAYFDKYANLIFIKFNDLPFTTNLKAVAFPGFIHYIPVERITLDFFNSIINEVKSNQDASKIPMRCLANIISSGDIANEYYYAFFNIFDWKDWKFMSSFLRNIAKFNMESVKKLSRYLYSYNQISYDRVLFYKLILAEYDRPNQVEILDLIKDGFNNYYFINRLLALSLLVSGSRKCFTIDEINMLKYSIPRLITPQVSKYKSDFISLLEKILSKSKVNDKDFVNIFFNALIEELEGFLKPICTPSRKSFAINCFICIWKVVDDFYISDNLVENLIYSLFDTDYSMRESAFNQLVMLIQRTKHNPSKYEILSRHLDENNKITLELTCLKINDEKDADSVSRLQALLYYTQSSNVDEIISRIWNQIDQKNIDLTSIFIPLKSLYYIIECSPIPNINFICKLFHCIFKVMEEALEHLSIDPNPELFPCSDITSDDNTSSQLSANVNYSWLAVEPCLKFFNYFLFRFFTELPKDIVTTAGYIIFRFILESKYHKTVDLACSTFQTFCKLCFLKDEINGNYYSHLPMEFADMLINISECFSVQEHLLTKSFVSISLALIRSEPLSLNQIRKPLFDRLMSISISYLSEMPSENQFYFGLFNIEAIDEDKESTMSMLEFYINDMIIALLESSVHDFHYTHRCLVSKVIVKVLKRRLHKWSDEISDFETLLVKDHKFITFILDNVLSENPSTTNLILTMIQIANPKRLSLLEKKLVDLCSHRVLKIRKQAAQILVSFLSKEEAIKQVISIFNGWYNSTSNTIDGMVHQICFILRRYKDLKTVLRDSAEDLINGILRKHETSYIKLYFVVQIAIFFGLETNIESLLRYFINNIDTIITLPYGDRIILAACNVLSETEIIQRLNNCTDSIRYLMTLYLRRHPNKISNNVSDALLNILFNCSPLIFTIISKLIVNNQVVFSGNGEIFDSVFEKALCENIIFNETKMIHLIKLSPVFKRFNIGFLKNFSEFANFVDFSRTHILEVLSTLLYQHRKSFFNDTTNETIHWELAIRMLSDNSEVIRNNIAPSLSEIFSSNHTTLSEYDIISSIYRKFLNNKEFIRKMKNRFNTSLPAYDGFKPPKSIPVFLFPPNVHLKIIKTILQENA